MSFDIFNAFVLHLILLGKLPKQNVSALFLICIAGKQIDVKKNELMNVQEFINVFIIHDYKILDWWVTIC